jgi:hypothetical protein
MHQCVLVRWHADVHLFWGNVFWGREICGLTDAVVHVNGRDRPASKLLAWRGLLINIVLEREITIQTHV